jgi:3-hydroxyisobutyrate dehydrogenase-like beta-hydroxyacid dehydrogenase
MPQSANQPDETAPLRRIGVLGMGIMGSPMACSLLRAGFQVMVFNRTPEKCGTVAAQGARVADSIARLAAENDAVIVMLPDDAAVEAVVHAPDGLAAGCKSGLIVMNSSTVHPRTNQRLGMELADKQVTLIDAPVTGSRPQAEAGQLYFLVGSDEATYRRCIPLFEAMGRGSIHVGPVGAGACAKLGNNMMGFINLSGLVEALQMVTRFGIAPEAFLEVLANSGGRSAFSEAKGPKIVREDWSADFALKLAAKDLQLANELSGELQQTAPILAQVTESFAQAAKEHGSEDVCSLIRWYREQIR